MSNHHTVESNAANKSLREAFFEQLGCILVAHGLLVPYLLSSRWGHYIRVRQGSECSPEPRTEDAICKTKS